MLPDDVTLFGDRPTRAAKQDGYADARAELHVNQQQQNHGVVGDGAFNNHPVAPVFQPPPGPPPFRPPPLARANDATVAAASLAPGRGIGVGSGRQDSLHAGALSGSSGSAGARRESGEPYMPNSHFGANVAGRRPA